MITHKRSRMPVLQSVPPRLVAGAQPAQRRHAALPPQLAAPHGGEDVPGAHAHRGHRHGGGFASEPRTSRSAPQSMEGKA
jgi:hypothetical protein